MAQLLSDLRLLDHPSPDERQLPAELRREVRQELHPVDARGERGDDQPSLGAREQLLERGDDTVFRSREAGPLDVRAVGQQRQHAVRAQFGEPMKVEVLAVERRLVDLEIARVDHRPHRRSDRHRERIRDAVRHPDELDRQVADRHPFARLHRHQAVRRVDAVALELRPGQRERQRRAVDRSVEVREDVRDGANVILVAVREHQRRRLRRALLEVREVRDHLVDAQHLGVWEHQAGVDQDERVAPRHGGHVHAELAETAKRNDLERGHARIRRPCVGHRCRPVGDALRDPSR